MSLSAARATAVRDVLLVSLTFGSGAVDAISFLGLARVFTANMTGNLVLLGLALGRGANADAVRSGVSLAAFSFGLVLAWRVIVLTSGSALTSRDRRKVRLWPWGVTVVLAIEAMIQAGFLGGWLASSAHPGITLKAVLAGLSALAMGLQSGAVGSLGVSGITSTYVTGTMAGLLQAVALGTGDVRNRARRAAVIVGLVAGATVAGVLMVDARRVAPVVPLTVTVAALLTALWRLRRA